EAAEKAQAERWERTRQRFLPTLHEPLTFRDGSPATAWGIVEGHRLLVAETLAEKQAEAEARRKQAEQWAKETGNPLRVPLEDGRAAYLEGVFDGLPVYKGTFNLNAARTISTDRVRPGGDTGLNLTGTNTFFGMWDEGAVRTSHLEFTNRVTRMDGLTNINSHATGVAGTLTASGLLPVWIFSGGNWYVISNGMRGMAYQSPLGSWDFTDDSVKMRGAVVTNAIELSNHSYGLRSGWEQLTTNLWRWWGFPFVDPNQDPKFGQYNTITREFDSITYDNPFYLTVWAAGNDQNEGPTNQPVSHIAFALQGELIVTNLVTNIVRQLDGDAGGFDTMSPQASAKNVVTVGAVFPIPGGYTNASQVVLGQDATGRTFSSCGPTDDGRIKPDVVADGVQLITTDSDTDDDVNIRSGTSFAAPSVSGSINLLRQRYEQLHPEAPPLRVSTWKALVIHTADEAGPHPGPDYRFGWGLMNTRRAALLLGQNATNGWKAFVKEVRLEPGGVIEFPVVAAGGTNELRVTHAWTDAPGVAESVFTVDSPNVKLVNDLDLRVISPSGVTNFPYVLNPVTRTNAATKADNSRDNVEQVVITNAVAHEVYLVRITHKWSLTNNLAQWDSIALSGIVPQPKPILRITDFAVTGTNTLMMSWDAVVGQNYQVQSRNNVEGPGWTDIGGVVNAARTNASVTLPHYAQQPHRFFRVIEVP
ncbi:MAG: S8 family serine peptidase, partial [Verrucomicrobiia bacterium]